MLVVEGPILKGPGCMPVVNGWSWGERKGCRWAWGKAKTKWVWKEPGTYRTGMAQAQGSFLLGAEEGGDLLAA